MTPPLPRSPRPQVAAPPLPAHLLTNLLHFGRLLRAAGLSIHPGRMMDLAAALRLVNLGSRPDVYHTMRALLVHRQEDLALFDRVFALFWRKPSRRERPFDPLHDLRRQQQKPDIIPLPIHQPAPPTNQPTNAPPAIAVTRAYSAQEALRHKDFGDLTPDEETAVRQLMQQFNWQAAQRRTRRRQSGPGPQLDMRRSLRRSLRTGGEFMVWHTRRPRRRPRPLVILADISGSMERYTRLLLHFIYMAVCAQSQPVEAFVFSARLTRITRQLGHKSLAKALAEVSTAVPDWSGGTRIGAALKRFNTDWGRRVLGGGAVALLISDGWDRGDPDLLACEIGRLHRSCHRLIWLNPLLGLPRYQPLTRGIQAALPHIDDFLPVHNLVSLEDLMRHLQKLGG